MHACRRAVLSALLAAAAIGCESTPAERPISLMPGATYHSPADNFTCIVPPLLGPGVRQSQATADATVADVAFSDDFGTLLDVRSRRIPDDELHAYARANRQASLDADFDAQVLPQLKARSPGLTVLRRETVDSAAGPALFVVVNMPGGSTRELHDTTGNAYHPDVVRGLLVFPQLHWVYAVSVQQWPPTLNAPPLTPDGRDARVLSDLQQAVASMTFN